MEGNFNVPKKYSGIVKFILAFVAAFLGCFTALMLISYAGTNLKGQFIGELKPRINVKRKQDTTGN